MRPLPVAIASAPNGARRTTSDHPNLPVTIDRIARTAAEVKEAGAAMIHVHVRDREQRHILDADLYRTAIAAIRRAAGREIITQITTESVGRYSAAEQMAVVEAVRPEAVSIALREIAPTEDDRGAASRFLRSLSGRGAALQIIIYDERDAARLDAWADDGDIDPALVSILYVLGRYHPPLTASPRDLLAFAPHSRTRFRDWMVCAFGPAERPCGMFAALLGGDVRIGFENNIARADGTLAASNAEAVASMSEAIQAAGLRVASADDLRNRWALTMN